MKKNLLITLFLLTISLNSAVGQLSIETCYEMAREHYPQTRQFDLIRQSASYTLSNASKAYLPQFSLSARATLQSDVTQMPISLPGISVPVLSKDQYQTILQVDQVIWDGGNVHAQKKLAEASSEAEHQQLEVDLYALYDRVNQLFFGTLLMEEQLRLNTLYCDELSRQSIRVTSYLHNGVATQSDLDAVHVQELVTKQERIAIESTIEAYRQMLSALIGSSFEQVELLRPEVDQYPLDILIQRPELDLFEAQAKILDRRASAVKARNRPHLGAYVQGGYGNPGLNMLKNGFTPYAIGGIRLSWYFGGYYTQKNDLRNIELSRQSIEIAQETFLFNTRMQINSAQTEVRKYHQTMAEDTEIIRLRENIRRSAEAKVEQGAITVIDMMREVTAEQAARQSRVLHQMQLLLSIYQLKNLSNQ